MSYQYQPLRYDDEIRLVEIQPGPYSQETIHCDIVHRRKSDKELQYEALSYTWGSTSHPKIIKIGPTSSNFAVTSNCYDALRRFRDPDTTWLIWIDALCIHQEDMEERTHQVRVMGGIYAQASTVLVYLGEADEDSELVFSHINDYYPDGAEFDATYEDSLPFPETLVEATKRVLKRPWFSRLWVLQEAFHGIGNVEVWCGPDMLHWDQFAGCSIVHCHSGADGFEEYAVGVPYALGIGGDPRRRRDIFSVLCQTRHTQCADPRDKFFGILSLIEDERDDGVEMLADYTHSTTIVYTSIGQYLLQKIKLHMLLAIRHPHANLPSLASWIPDWSRTDDGDPFWIDGEPWYDDLGYYVPEIRNLPCCRPHNPLSDHVYHPILSVKGYRVGQIHSLGQKFDFKTSYNECATALKYIVESKGTAKDISYLPADFKPECYNEGVFRKLCDRDHGFSRLSNFEFIEGALHDCRLFLDRNGYIGIAPSEAEVGDLICLVLGASEPVLLRQRADGYWTLISGECFFNNFHMRVLDSEWCREIVQDYQDKFDFGPEEVFKIW